MAAASTTHGGEDALRSDGHGRVLVHGPGSVALSNSSRWRVAGTSGFVRESSLARMCHAVYDDGTLISTSFVPPRTIIVASAARTVPGSRDSPDDDRRCTGAGRGACRRGASVRPRRLHGGPCLPDLRRVPAADPGRLLRDPGQGLLRTVAATRSSPALRVARSRPASRCRLVRRGGGAGRRGAFRAGVPAGRVPDQSAVTSSSDTWSAWRSGRAPATGADGNTRYSPSS